MLFSCSILGGGRLQRQHPRRRQLGGHVGQHPLDRLVVGDRLTELLALLRVGNRLVERRLPDAERLRRDRDAAALQRPHRQLGIPDRHGRAPDRRATVTIELEVHAAEAADAERIGARRSP